MWGRLSVTTCAGRLISNAVGVAQLVELLVVVQAVGGSSPLAHPQRSRAGLLKHGCGEGNPRRLVKRQLSVAVSRTDTPPPIADVWS